MRTREVVGTAAWLLIGAAAGVGIMRWSGGGRGATDAETSSSAPRAEAFDRPRAPTVDELAQLDPSSAPVPCFDGVVPTVVTRDGIAKPSEPDDAIDRLREQVAALEREVQRLRALLADGGAHHHELRKLVAANDLQHGRLYEELLGLIVDDAEGVAEDPRRAFETIVRLIDETGLAGAERTKEFVCDIAPEPAAPDLRLFLEHGANDERIDPEDGTPSFVRHSEEVGFRAQIELPDVPEKWLGQPLSATVDLTVEESDRETGWLHLTMKANVSALAPEVTWNLDWHDGEAYINRSPYRGSQEIREATPADLATERGWVDRIFQQLMTRWH